MNWWPKKIIPLEMVSAIRRLGKRGIAFRQLNDDETGIGLASGTIDFVNLANLTLAEKQAKADIRHALLTSLAAVLAEGPKLFVIPPDLIDDLNQIDIPLKVEDYSQPFPAVIVKSDEEYHFAINVDKRLQLATMNGHILDFVGFMDSNKPIEHNLSAPDVWHRGPDFMFRMADAESVHGPHRFRATLNFLLLVMAGGFTQETQRKLTNKPKKHSTTGTKHLITKKFVPQKINLWRKRVIDANNPKGSDGSGTKKSPHWRRAHWRRVATGAGRTNRELRLIAACLVNKKCLVADPANSQYECS